MDKKKLFSLLQLFLTPVLVIVLGLILIFNPDSASALISKLIGWIVCAFGVCFGISALVGEAASRTSRFVKAAIGLIVGIWLVNNPLLLAKWIGRFLGFLLLIQGGLDLLSGFRAGRGLPIVPLLTTVVGLVLTMTPMTTSRLLFSICGIVVLCVGVAMLADRLRDHRRLTDGSNFRIIDADE